LRRGRHALNRKKMLEVEELRREADKLDRVYMEVHEDNNLLEEDIEKYKEIVKILNRQNEELVNELERISQVEDDSRSLYSKKDRLEALIYKAEAHLGSGSKDRR
jgi:SMC interacting uncharacterized protein involved in chromosome segregation